MFALLMVIMAGIVTPAHISPQTITPIPFDKINPRANEFRRLDKDGDEQITFTEFILGDQHYIEMQSAAFHKLDEDGDGVVSRGEYDSYYKKFDDDRRRSDIERDRFFERLNIVMVDHRALGERWTPADTVLPHVPSTPSARLALGEG
uniref:EF-hand domain-containing protein n=1 Tax=Angiostrongylus cantonensis TaxID=6313 RepID=A0A158PC47_ANGCA